MTRNTVQRQQILAFLKSTHAHPSAEEVHKRIVKGLPSVTLATVYRNLNNLAEEGVLHRLKVGNAYRYDFHQHGGTHGVCTSCGKVIDLEGEKIAKKALESFRGPHFTPESITIILHGACKACERTKVKRP
jgi:Fur family peroxide stress response transcriptional regulator